jgi:uncharacterized protein (DUF2249 family)
LTGVKAGCSWLRYGLQSVNKNLIKLDVRDDLRAGREPFSRILQAVAGLAPGQDLLLIAPFEPAPLIGVLAGMGLGHASRQTDSGNWEVRFSRNLPVQSQAGPPSPGACSGSPAIEVDARGLEPPQPMVKILEAIASLPSGASLRARTDRRPMHLFAQLEARGFTGESVEQTDGSFITHIRHVSR